MANSDWHIGRHEITFIKYDLNSIVGEVFKGKKMVNKIYKVTDYTCKGSYFFQPFIFLY